MGCGESKNAVATTEPIKKSASRSSSRKIETPVQDKPTKTVTRTVSSVTTVKNGDSKAIVEGSDKNGAKPVGVIPGEPFIYQRPPMEAANAVRKDVVSKEEKKKLVVVVAHDRTASKESQVSDYFSDAIEEKSEHDSPQPDEVVVVQEHKKTESKQEEVVTQIEDDQAVVPTQEVQAEDEATMATEEETVMEAVQEAVEDKPTMAETEIMVQQETKTIGTDEIKLPQLKIRTTVEKINDI